MITAVAYVRMSSNKQEASPNQQREEITKLAEREGYRIIRWYTDETPAEAMLPHQKSHF